MYSESKAEELPALESARSMGVIIPVRPHRAGTYFCSTVIVASKEPFGHVDTYLLEEQGEKVVQGLKLAMSALRAEQGIVAVKITGAFAALDKILQDRSNIRAHLLEDFYPASYLLLNSDLSGDDCLAYDPETLANLYDARERGIPVTRKLVSCTGEVAKPSIIIAPLGTSFRELIELCGGATTDEFVILNGNPMHSDVILDIDTPVEKGTSGILVLARDHELIRKALMPVEFVIKRIKSVCTQCGFCTELCPVYLTGCELTPHTIIRQIISGTVSEEDCILSSMLCIGCGLCDIICPVGLNPQSIIRTIQQSLRDRGVSQNNEKERGKPLNMASVRSFRRIPTQVVINRLDLQKYNQPLWVRSCEANPDQVELLLRQVGSNPVPLVRVGDKVSEGDLVVRGLDPGDVTLHASISGTVTLVDEKRIIIAA